MKIIYIFNRIFCAFMSFDCNVVDQMSMFVWGVLKHGVSNSVQKQYIVVLLIGISVNFKVSKRFGKNLYFSALIRLTQWTDAIPVSATDPTK